MEKTILRAKILLSELFDINLNHFEKHTTRATKVIEARRFLVYFLKQELNLTYSKIIEIVPAITNHATAIHHYKKLKGFLNVEAPTLRLYEEFKNTLLNCDNVPMIEREILDVKNDIKLKRIQIKQLKNLL
jgi:hypothetical protein|tara:strand:+ start:1871 stop:2263 length:393 start_codon:yes stop_codon:yes gene_type:complete